MIEVVYTSKDSDKSNDIIRLPKNIKQIGDIKDSRKIYIEDYAISYIEEVHLYGMDRAVGVLLGKSQKSGSDRYIFVKGAILIPNAFISETQIEITENDWAEIYNNLGKYFQNQEIVGWFTSLEGVNAAMLRTIKKVHMDQFPGGEKVLFVFDRQEKSQYFCVYENNQLVRQKGYTIYYERNEEMQDYMVDMRSGYEKAEEIKNIFASNTMNTKVNEGEAVKDMITPAATKRQSFVNYCANVAMVVLVLFIGMYMLDAKKDQQEQSDTISSTITPVIKVDGDVYPTQGVNGEQESGAVSLQQETTSSAQEQTKETVEETTGSVQTSLLVTPLNQGVQPSVTQGGASQETTQEVTQATTQESTQAASSGGAVITVSTDEQRKTNTSPATYVEYVVQKGENLITICKKTYGDTSRIEEIMELNDIDDMDKIYIGQIIKLP